MSKCKKEPPSCKETYWAVQNTTRTHLLGMVPCIKCFKINFFPKIPKIRFINFKLVFLKMQFFYSQFQNIFLAIFALFGLLFFNVLKQSSTTYLTISKFTFADLWSFSWSTSHIYICLRSYYTGRSFEPIS